MSYIDNIRMKALNAGSGNVSITGNDLLSLINEIQAGAGNGTVTSVSGTAPLSGTVTTSGSLTTSMATNKLIGRGTAGTGVMEEITLGTGLSLAGTTLNAATGLATNGSTTGATGFNQEFSKGVTVGAANTEDGVLNFFNNADATQVVVTSPTTKQLTVDNTGHDAEVGINGAAESGVAFKVTGSAKTTAGLTVGTTFQIVDNTSTITQPSADEMLLTATSGVQISNKLAVDEINGKSVAGTILLGDSNGTTYINVDNANTRIDLNTSTIRINGNIAYTGTFDPAAVTSISVENGIITSVS